MPKKCLNGPVLACLALMAAAFCLRAFHIGAPDITNDEDLNLALAGKSLPEVVRFVSPRPPLVFAVQRVFSAAVGTHDIRTIRLASVLEGAAGAGAMFALAYRLFGLWPAVISGGLLAFSSFHFVECRLARYYPLLMLCALLFLLLYVEMMENRRLRLFPAACLAGVLALATHQGAALFLLACVLAAPVFLTAPPWRETIKLNRRLLAWSGAAASAGLAIGLVLLRGQAGWFLKVIMSGRGGGRRTLDFDVSPGFLLEFFREYVGVPEWAVVPCLLLFLAGAVHICRARWRFGVLSALILVVPFAAIYLVNPAGQWRSKYFIFMLPILLLAVSVGIWRAATWASRGNARAARFVKPAAAAALAAIVIAPNLSAMLHQLKHPPQTYQRAAQLLTEWTKPGDQIRYTQKWRHRREDRPWDLWVILHNYYSTTEAGTAASYAGTAGELGWSPTDSERLWCLHGGQWHASDEVSRFFFSNKLSRVPFDGLMLGYGPNTQGILFGGNTGPDPARFEVLFSREGERMVLVETKGPAPDEVELSVNGSRAVLNRLDERTCGGVMRVPFGKAEIRLAAAGEAVAAAAVRFVPLLGPESLEIPAWDFYELNGGVNWQSMFSQETPEGILIRGMRGWVEARYYFYAPRDCEAAIELSALNDAPGAHEYDVSVANKSNKREVLVFDRANDRLSERVSAPQRVLKGLNLVRVRYHGGGGDAEVRTAATMTVNGVCKITIHANADGN